MSACRGNKVLLALVLIAAFLMIIWVPFLIYPVVGELQPHMYDRQELFKEQGEMMKRAMIMHVPIMVGWTYPMWAFLSVFAGGIILAVARPFYNGSKWARSLILACLAVPAIGGAYMFIPYSNFVTSATGKMSPTTLMALVGLIPYFAILMTGLKSAKQRVIVFLVFALMGMVATYTFGNGTAAHRILMAHPKMPVYPDMGIMALQGMRMGWIGVAALFTSVYFLSMRTVVGYYLTISAAFICAAANFYTSIWRYDTVDYYTAGLMAVAIIVLVVVGKKELLEENAEALERCETGIEV